MKKSFDQVYQFKIALMYIKPSIWRRIQVPENYSFWDLHVAIQDAMGWYDSHLHQFTMTDPKAGMTAEIGIPDEDGFSEGILAGWKNSIAKYFSSQNSQARYEYDFGDGWGHIITLEKILPRDENVSYPICIDGKRACPPEDCGGFSGYEDLLEIIKNPDHEEYEEWMEWLGGEYDPEAFDPQNIDFDDPKQRLEFVLGG